MKTCSKCKKEKPLTEFHRRGDGHQHWCKRCSISARINYYKNNKNIEQQKVRKRINKLVAWNHELKKNPCVDCGKTYHPAQMQWDHINEKENNISDMIRLGLSKERILKEIEKCELRCANCHALKTWLALKAMWPSG